MVQDLRPVNDIVEDYPAEVPNAQVLLTNVPADAKVSSVINLVQAFFSIRVAPASWGLFAFQYEGRTLQYTRLPQGYKHSPHIFKKVLAEDLRHIVCRSTLLQYVDDLLLCSPYTIHVLTVLANGGYKVSRKKLQFAQSQVIYLGRLISRREKAGTRASGNDNLKNKLTWTTDAEEAFIRIKEEMQQAPALALPDYDKPFCLYVTTKREPGQNTYMAAILGQNQCRGKGRQAIAYYCTKLDSVVQGYSPCYQGLHAVYVAYTKAKSITMGWPVTIYTSHAIAQLAEQGKFCLTPQRQLRYYNLPFLIDVTIKTCDTATNPADYLPPEYDGTPHECVADSKAFSKLREDLESEPLEGAVVYFVDGSSHNYKLKSPDSTLSGRER
ncbi:hypothetical protein ACEWY4_013950 [Coilia grayii]|uniref:ribonuclease H n=1 Tax=Coilia grayii TaxID=363190 RepID=A0ABD1JQV9_9TELE